MSKNPLGGARNAAIRQRTMLDSLKKQKISDDYLKQMPRRWRNGNVYAPHDLSPTEMDKWRRIRKPEVDVIDMLGINPKDHYRVCRIPANGTFRRNFLQTLTENVELRHGL